MNPVNYLGQKITDSSDEIALRHLQIVILYDLRLLFHNNSPFLRVKGFGEQTVILSKNR